MHKKVMFSLNQETLEQIKFLKQKQNVNSASDLIRRLIEKEFTKMNLYPMFRMSFPEFEEIVCNALFKEAKITSVNRQLLKLSFDKHPNCASAIEEILKNPNKWEAEYES